MSFPAFRYRLAAGRPNGPASSAGVRLDQDSWIAAHGVVGAELARRLLLGSAETIDRAVLSLAE